MPSRSSAPPRLHGQTRLRAWLAPGVIAAGLVLVPLLALRPIADPSPWLHLRIGRFLLEGHRFTLPDPWAPFASKTYVPTQWLPSVLTSRLYDAWGNPVIVWERAAGIALLTLVLLLVASSIARTWVAAAVTVAAMFAAWPGLTERPQLLGFLVLVPVLYAWWRTGLDRRPRWYLIPLTWLAASTHGIWATGLAVGALVTGTLLVSGRLTRPAAVRLVALLGACTLAAAATPVGPKLLLTPFEVSAQGRQFVQEWLPSSVRSPHVLAALLLLALAWLCWIQLRERPALWQTGLLLAGVAMALAMQRTVPVAAFVAVPLACTSIESLLSQREARLVPAPAAPGREKAWRLWTISAVIGIALAIPLAAARGGEPTGVPNRLLPQLAAQPAGTRILADADVTGWVLFASPQLAPVEDIRIESYSPSYITRYIAAMAAEPGWDTFVHQSGATVALLPEDSPLLAALTEQSGWTTMGSDAGRVLIEAHR